MKKIFVYVLLTSIIMVPIVSIIVVEILNQYDMTYTTYSLSYDYDDLEKEYIKVEDIEEVLQCKGKFTGMEHKDVQEMNQVEWSSYTDIKCVLMIVISFISGISICGTMENSVAGRKKEIGIKKALGAKDIDIMVGFLIENLFNSIISIIISISITSSVFLIYIYYQRNVLLVDYTIRFYPITWFLFICYAVSAVVGFSLIPAYRASQINIVDTLRVE